MANIKSQKKRVLTNEKARLRNKAYKSDLRTSIRKVNETVAAANKAEAVSALAVATKKLDRAASRGILHKNNVANKKSKLTLKVNSLK